MISNSTVEPKPYDILPEEEPRIKRCVRFKNDTNHIITIGQLPSDWDAVNFVIEDYKSKSKSKHRLVRWLATLEPTDIMQLDFSKPKRIEQ